MPKPKSPTIPQHTMQLYVMQCVAAGITGREFARRSGLTRDQGTRLSSLIAQRTRTPHPSDKTGRLTSDGSIIPANAAQSLSTLSNRMVNGLLGTGTRAVEMLETLNARYETRRDEAGNVLKEEPDAIDLRRWKFAISVCSLILQLARKDSRDAPGPIETNVEPIQRTMDAQPAGMLTVVASEGNVDKTSEA